MRDRELRLKEQKYPKTMIRVRFPDRFILEATFYSGALGWLASLLTVVSDLFALVKEHLEVDRPFRLYVTPPHTNLDPAKSFWSQKLAPACLVHFASLDTTHAGSSFLNQSALASCADYPIALPPEALEAAADSDEEEHRPKPALAEPSNSDPAKKPDETGPKRPKWFKLK
ncbi:Tether containing UBX domain for GLUT4 [Kappamyces sp. JEL0680]|nr:Tether containing UBX domain for GLUT4 [Kappamyces sp. JEL0680]